MADICNTLNLIFTAISCVVGAVALAHAAWRTVPASIVKFRVAYTIGSLLYAVQVLDSVLNGPGKLQIVIGLLSPATLWTMILYFFEHYATVWAKLLVAHGPPSRTTRRLQQYLQCFPYFRAFIVPYAILVAGLFIAMPQNWPTVAAELSHMLAYVVALGPGFLLVGRMVMVLDSHRRESLKFEREAEMCRMGEKQRDDSNSGSSQQSSNPSTQKPVTKAPSWKSSRNARIRTVLRQMIIFLVVAGIATLVSAVDSVFIIGDTLEFPLTGEVILEGHPHAPGQFEVCEALEVIGILFRHLTYIIAVFVSRAPSAPRREWTKSISGDNTAIDTYTSQNSQQRSHAEMSGTAGPTQQGGGQPRQYLDSQIPEFRSGGETNGSRAKGHSQQQRHYFEPHAPQRSSGFESPHRVAHV